MAEVKDYSAEALMAKEHEVELDTDDVKEENVSVEESKKEDSPNLNVGEVDLGYTDHSKPVENNKEKPDIEIIEDKTEETGDVVENKQEEEKPNLSESRRDYQKRIDKLVYERREALRREKAAVEYAKGIQKKFDLSIKKLNSTDDQYLKELDARVDAQREQVKVALQSAIESQDASKIMEANDRLTQLAVEKEKARLEMINRVNNNNTYKLNLKQRNHHNQSHKLHLKPKNGLKKISGLGMMRS
jgi:hypothetical protein